MQLFAFLLSINSWVTNLEIRSTDYCRWKASEHQGC